MKLSISNIAWDPCEDDAIGCFLRNRGVASVEIAPTKYWPAPCAPSTHEVTEVRKQWEGRGQRVVAMQSLLYGRSDLSIFGDESVRQATREYLDVILRIASGLGSHVVVFGSPANRDREDRSMEKALEEAAAFFHPLAGRAQDLGCVIGFEPNPTKYRCNFCTTVDEAVRLVNAVDHPGFQLHLDTGIMHINGEEPHETVSRASQYMAHVHISEPDLAVIGSNGVPHAVFAGALRMIPWNGHVSIEMRGGNGDGTSVDRVRNAVDVAQEFYFE